MQDITVRRMNFDFPDDLDPIVQAGAPEESYTLIGLSLLLPYLEPYLIRTMKVARKRLTDPDLIADLERFNAQEGQHFRQHRRFNEVVCRSGFDRLPEFEAELEADYRRFSDTKSLRFNLAYAEGFEALTTASALFMFENGAQEGLHPAAADLFEWHMLEELEHRTVAFDVYDRVCGGYFYRLVAGTYAQWHMLQWIGRVTGYLLEADERCLRDYGGQAGRRQRQRHAGRMRMKLLPKVLKTYLPWYTPHKIEVGPRLREMGDRYTQRAIG
jgi:hypothetical protein